MKRIISVSLGRSDHNYTFKTQFIDTDFEVQRVGVSGDPKEAWEQLQRLQTRCDAIGIGMVQDHSYVGEYEFENAETKRLMQVVTRVPVTTGARLRRIMQSAAVRYVQKELGNYFNNNKVLFLSGMANYELASVMHEWTPNLKFADPVIQAGVPKLITSLNALELWARGKHSFNNLTIESLRSSIPKPTQVQRMVIRRAMADAHVIVGTVSDILKYGDLSCLEGKTLVTSKVDDVDFESLKEAKVNLAIDITPHLFDHVVGLNVLEAMILAASDVEEELTPVDIHEIVREIGYKPRMLHPTGDFRLVRRFGFIVHPLSAEYIRNVAPVPDRFAIKPIMSALEKTFAYSPPLIYSEVKGIRSPAGVDCEGWLITVGGTPKEMLSHSPEFTYRRLLTAAKMAEKLGAQILGLGAFTKVVGDAGVTVARRSSIPVTTGNSYSASGALWAAHDAIRRMGLIRRPPKGKKVAGKAMIIGATGSIGSVSARLMAMVFQEVYISARSEGKLNELKASILEDTPDAKVIVSTDSDAHLDKMDMIVTSTSGAGKKILDITRVKPGCVITDVARPLDLPPSEVAKRPDVLVIESGEIELPGDIEMKSIKLPKNVVFACMAETIALAMEGRFEVFTIGRRTEWQKVKEIYRLGLKHGMKLAAISGVNGAFSDEDIQQVAELAREKRKTWKPFQDEH